VPLTAPRTTDGSQWGSADYDGGTLTGAFAGAAPGLLNGDFLYNTGTIWFVRLRARASPPRPLVEFITRASEWWQAQSAVCAARVRLFSAGVALDTRLVGFEIGATCL